MSVQIWLWEQDWYPRPFPSLTVMLFLHPCLAVSAWAPKAHTPTFPLALDFFHAHAQGSQGNQPTHNLCQFLG